MIKPLKIILLGLSIVFSVTLYCFAENPAKESTKQQDLWHLPQKISDSNTNVTFDLDSTWHKFTGQTSHIYGKIWLDQPDDYRSIRAKINLPVMNFDTDSEGRDEKMRKVMAEENYPAVVFELENVKGLCDPGDLNETVICPVRIAGKLTIRDVTKAIDFEATIGMKDGKFTITGQEKLDWSDYNVEDPSILIAKLYKEVIINFTIIL